MRLATIEASEIVIIESRYGRDPVRVLAIAPTARLFVVAEPYTIPKGRIMRPQKGRKPVVLENDFVLHEGELFYPHWHGDSLYYDHYAGGLYDAIRGRAQTMLGYGRRDVGVGEPRALRLLQSSIRSLCALLANYARLDEEEQAAISRSVGITASKLVAVRNPEKISAQRQLLQSVSVRDSLLRPNQGAARARLVSSVDHLDLRLEEIRRITPRVGYYEFALLAERDRVLAIFKEVDQVLRLWVGERGLLYGESRQINRSRVGMAVRLNSLAKLVQTVTVEPFLGTRDRLTREFVNANQMLGVSNIPETIEALHRALERVTLEFIRSQLEILRTELSCAVTARRAAKTAHSLQSHLEQFVRNTKLLVRHQDLRPDFRLLAEARATILAAQDSFKNRDWIKAKELLADAAEHLSK